jgi:hypothetical protein
MVPSSSSIGSCYLRTMHYRDAWCLRSAFNIPGFDRGMTMKGPFSIIGALKIIYNFKKAARRDFSHPFTIIDDHNHCMGQIWMIYRNEWHIGFWLHPKFQHKGYMRSAVKHIASFAKKNNICPHAYVCDWNEKSKNVLYACDFYEVSRNSGKIKFSPIA